MKTFIVELVGPAGAGKTTLREALVGNNPLFSYQSAPFPRSIRNLPFYLANLVNLTPNLLLNTAEVDRPISRREIAWLCIVNGWDRELTTDRQAEGKIIILDQGPIFLLTSLYYFGPSFLRSQRFEQFWQNRFKAWAGTLNVVVLLDATNTSLMKRINTREQSHVIKNKDIKKVEAFLEDWRTGYSEIIQQISSYHPHPLIIHCNSESDSASDISTSLQKQIEEQYAKF